MDGLHDFVATSIAVDKIEQIIQQKASILGDIFDKKGIVPKHILSLSFNPIILDFALQGSTICFLSENKAIIKYAKEISDYYDLEITCHEMSFDAYYKHTNESFDVILGLDQYFTYATSEDDQQDKIHNVLSLLYDNGILITSVIDYKNMNYNEKVFPGPHNIHHLNNNDYILVSNRKWDTDNRKQWIHHSYAINQTDNSLIVFTPVVRQALFFKQFAYHTKFVGWSTFTVHNEALYRPIYNNHNQYIISVTQ